uniref:Uncharacterized protein n=1 Tax=Anopheles atroparvus TaxID=41427 RepID=A0AAG5D697_ANOAO
MNCSKKVQKNKFWQILYKYFGWTDVLILLMSSAKARKCDVYICDIVE